MATRTKKTTPNPDGLAEALNAGAHLNKNTGGTPCHVQVVLEQLPDDLSKKVRVAIDNPAVSAASLAGLLTDNGYEIRAASISRHRKRGTATGCRCPK